MSGSLETSRVADRMVFWRPCQLAGNQNLLKLDQATVSESRRLDQASLFLGALRRTFNVEHFRSRRPTS